MIIGYYSWIPILEDLGQESLDDGLDDGHKNDPFCQVISLSVFMVTYPGNPGQSPGIWS